MTQTPREAALGLAWRADDGLWRGSLAARDMTVEVAGTPHGPDRARLSAARAVLERLDDLASALSAHLAAAEVPFEPDDGPPFGVRHPAPPVIAWVQLDATDPDRDDLVTVSFVTGHPDGNHLFVATIAGPEIEEVTGRLW